MDKITFCIPSKSNLRYLKTCIPSIRENAFRNDHDIIIFVDSDDDGTINWLDQVKNEYNLTYYVNPDLGKSLYGIGKAYDYCIKQSNTDIFMIFHADMMLGKHADLKAFEQLKPSTVVCSTRIEPPLHPNGGEKILLDFGMWPEEFKNDEFSDYVETHLTDDKITHGIFAPWMMHKREYSKLGGHDPILHSCREDSDIFNRMKLAGYKFIQPWNSLVYHLTGRGAGSFGGDTQRHDQWKLDMERSSREFIRKWGSFVKHTELLDPIVTPKYNIAFVVTNCNFNILSGLEMWCDRIYIDDEMQVLTSHYIDTEQPNTKFDLTKRIMVIGHNDVYGENDIVVEMDGIRISNEDVLNIQQLSQIIQHSGEIGTFQLGNLKITINNLDTYEKDLVVCN